MTADVLIGLCAAVLCALALRLPCARHVRVPAAALNITVFVYASALGLWTVLLPHAAILPLTLACLSARRRDWIRRRRDAAPPLPHFTPRASAARRLRPTRNSLRESPRR